jgi:prevent-host-death family protein
MDRTVSMAKAKSHLSELVGRAAYHDEHFVLERRGRPMAVLLGVDEYERLRALESPDIPSSLSPVLRQRQERLLAQAQALREQLGNPLKGLANILRDMPPESDEFWVEVEEFLG